jgi:thiamine biosynthesis lipoprotein ApbE
MNLSNAFQIYPNPTKGWINIRSDLKIETVSIISIEGKRIIRENATNKIDLNALAKGYYFIEIETEKGTIRKKIVKQ